MCRATQWLLLQYLIITTAQYIWLTNAIKRPAAMSVSVQPMGCCHDSAQLYQPASVITHSTVKSAFFSLKTTKTEIIYNIIFKGRVCLERWPGTFMKSFIRTRKWMASAPPRTSKSPMSRRRVICCLPQLLGIPPCVTYGTRRTGKAWDLWTHCWELFTQDKQHCTELILRFSTVSHSRDSRCPTFKGKI